MQPWWAKVKENEKTLNRLPDFWLVVYNDHIYLKSDI